MPYGNDNLMFIRDCQFITTDGTSDPGITLDKDTTAITIFTTADAWVNIGRVPVAVAPAEKTRSNGSFFVPTLGGYLDVAVPIGTDAVPVKVAAIQATGAGNVYIYQRKEV